MDLNLLKKLVRYDFEIGELFWNLRDPSDFDDKGRSPELKCRQWNTRNGGRRIGAFVDANGYCQFRINGTHFKVHRVVWALCNDRLPTYGIDHINGNRTDNRIVNLREANHVVNGRNQKLHKTNTSGTSGVSFHKKSQKWQVNIKDNGKFIHLGIYASKDEAIIVRKAAEKQFGYHDNHGSARTLEGQKRGLLKRMFGR